MRLHLKSLHDGIWNVTSKEYKLPTTPEDKCGEFDKKNETFKSRAINALYGVLNELEYSQIQGFNTTYGIWKSLKAFHKGTSHLRENNFYMPLQSMKISP